MQFVSLCQIIEVSSLEHETMLGHEICIVTVRLSLDIRVIFIFCYVIHVLTGELRQAVHVSIPQFMSKLDWQSLIQGLYNRTYHWVVPRSFPPLPKFLLAPFLGQSDWGNQKISCNKWLYRVLVGMVFGVAARYSPPSRLHLACWFFRRGWTPFKIGFYQKLRKLSNFWKKFLSKKYSMLNSS